MKSEIKLSERLKAAANLANVNKGSTADIGTDHALLPIWLVQNGHARALASDINLGPCGRARANIKKYGLDDKIKVVCRPGLDMIEEFAPENVIICGMGGEMITGILSESRYPADSGCRLILQPMSIQEVLRKYLGSAGFKITEELVVYEDGKYYQLIAAVYDGKIREFAECEYKLGSLNLERASAKPTRIDKKWLEFQMKNALVRIEGRKSSVSGVFLPEQAKDIEMVTTIKNILHSG